MTMRKVHILTFLLSAFIVGIILSVNLGLHPGIISAIKMLPFGDKVSHFFLFGLLSLLLNLSLRCRMLSWRQRRVQAGTFWLLGVVFLEECSQYWIPNRTFDSGDLLADVLGITVFAVIARKYQQRSAFT